MYLLYWQKKGVPTHNELKMRTYIMENQLLTIVYTNCSVSVLTWDIVPTGISRPSYGTSFIATVVIRLINTPITPIHGSHISTVPRINISGIEPLKSPPPKISSLRHQTVQKDSILLFISRHSHLSTLA